MMTYLQQLEILAFFSGYPIVYAITAALKNPGSGRNGIVNKAFYLLPIVYVFLGLLYIGLLLRNFYPNYSFELIKYQIQIPFYVCWAISSLFFIIPWLRSRPFICLLHSLIFFYLIVRNFYLQLSAPETDKNVLRNHMNIYFISIMFNILILTVLLLISYFIQRLRKRKGSTVS